MTAHTIRARPPRGDLSAPSSREITDRWLLDAAYFPGGRADALFVPRTEGEIAWVLRSHPAVLAVGAQSSLTGGATPLGGALVAMERFDGLAIDAASRTARCGAALPLARLRDEAAPLGLFCGPAPTYDGATIGGMAATNAAGAATFRHGTMRRSVRGLTVVLADGSVLDMRRGECTAHPDGWFDVVLADGRTTRVPVPTYRDPDVPKVSAGYFAAPSMDLVDLFVGSEGTLGVITEVVLDLLPLPAARVVCWLPVDDEARGVDVVRRLRAASMETWRTHDPAGIDVPAIEHFDRRCVELLLEDGRDREHRVPLESSTSMVLIFPVDLPAAVSDDDALSQIAGGDEPGAPDSALRCLAAGTSRGAKFRSDADDTPALRRLARLLGPDAERLEVALPSEPGKAARFFAMREAVPMAVNHRIRDRRLRDPAVTKSAGDFCVPWDRFEESLARYRGEFSGRGLDLAVWGHISDGNVHPNAIPRDGRDVAEAKEALLALAGWAVSVGGSPLAEHGVGRSLVKQAMLRMLRGDRGIEEMRAVKRALDPSARLAPGVLFPA